MTYAEALAYIHSVSWKGSRPGLSRITELCARLGDPQKSLRFIHVAGTNGKGSTCAMLASMLGAAGYRVGLFTSPFIRRFNERMQIGEGGRPLDIPDEALAEVTAYVKPFADAMADAPTEFELITAIALVYFARRHCDVVIFECGMGGRLDSTNILEASNVLASVITGIAMDHTEFLGDTMEKIAAEKAGIIKEGVPVVVGSGGAALPAVVEVIRAHAEEKHAPLTLTDPRRVHHVESTLDRGTSFAFDGMGELTLPLLGLYQPANAATALTVLEVLGGTGRLVCPPEAVRRGLAEVSWPGRFEIICRDPLVISDGGHNPEGIDAAVSTVKHYFGDKKIYLLSGVMADKDYTHMADRMSEVASRAFTVRPDNSRALDADAYAAVFAARGIPAEGYATVAEAVNAAMTACKQDNKALLCLGSLYMYGEVTRAAELYQRA